MRLYLCCFITEIDLIVELDFCCFVADAHAVYHNVRLIYAAIMYEIYLFLRITYTNLGLKKFFIKPTRLTARQMVSRYAVEHFPNPRFMIILSFIRVRVTHSSSLMNVKILTNNFHRLLRNAIKPRIQ